MFSFFKKKSPDAPAAGASPSASPQPTAAPAAPVAAPRDSWLARLKTGLDRTGASITSVFTGARVDDALYEELESALLMADAGGAATAHLLADLKRRVKAAGSTEPQQVKALLAHAIADLLAPLQRPLAIAHTPTVIMVVGVNGAGKTTSIGKLTQHLAASGAKVLLAAADTFRAAAREQLGVWADRNAVEIVSQAGGDPAAVSFDAVTAGLARGKDVVLIDTAGRLPTQLHLMDELRKIKRVIEKAMPAAAGPPQGGAAPLGGSAVRVATSVGAIPAGPHEVLLVIDGNTGQNALAQVKAFDEALQLTGLVITKLDGTAKGGVLCAIALWAKERAALRAAQQAVADLGSASAQQALAALGPADSPGVALYFIGVGERLEDLETFNAQEFAQALVA